MSEKSAIEWTDATWNPVLGCSKVSEGCRGCYAILQAWMKQSNPNAKVREAYAGLVEKRPDGSLNWTGKVNCIPERLTVPLGWKKPKRIFVNSLSDLFHDDVPDAFIDQVFAVMAWASHHTFQILTKRPERMAAYLSAPDVEHRIEMAMCDVCGMQEKAPCGFPGDDCGLMGTVLPLDNVWLGTSVEDDRVRYRVDELRTVPAAIRFLSVEPMLGPLDELNLDGIHWVITGGESGKDARPCHPEWVRDLRDQCQRAGVAFFHKQWGEFCHPSQMPDDVDGSGSFLDDLVRIGNHRSGRFLDGRTWDEFPAVRTAAGATS